MVGRLHKKLLWSEDRGLRYDAADLRRCLKKTVVVPSQNLDYIGDNFWTDVGKVFLFAHRRMKLCCHLRHILQKQKALVREWLQVQGDMPD
ncbi:hypothetical protein NDU88_002841 [Pleurodeles waltl]|uniref:Uncharacterized protein n=1 Tax=Pleurodeles waltl TaxID=8319 RepID=A0AAV7MNW8_PLEWA|nr:hypothetical protein NDU88_002841 [Pleurodeles waltl]